MLPVRAHLPVANNVPPANIAATAMSPRTLVLATRK